MALKTYARPSGTTITVTDTPDTRKYAQESGWKEHKAVKPKRKPRKLVGKERNGDSS